MFCKLIWLYLVLTEFQPPAVISQQFVGTLSGPPSPGPVPPRCLPGNLSPPSWLAGSIGSAGGNKKGLCSPVVHRVFVLLREFSCPDLMPEAGWFLQVTCTRLCCHHLPRVGACRAPEQALAKAFSIHPSGCSTAGILESSWVGLSLASSDQTELCPALGALPFGVTLHPCCFPLVSLVFHFSWPSCSSSEHQQPRLSDR